MQKKDGGVYVPFVSLKSSSGFTFPGNEFLSTILRLCFRGVLAVDVYTCEEGLNNLQILSARRCPRIIAVTYTKFKPRFFKVSSL